MKEKPIVALEAAAAYRSRKGWTSGSPKQHATGYSEKRTEANSEAFAPNPQKQKR